MRLRCVPTQIGAHRISVSEAQSLLSPTCRVTFLATGAQTASACMKYDIANRQFTFLWKLGQTLGDVAMSVQVTYPGTTIRSSLSEAIRVTR